MRYYLYLIFLLWSVSTTLLAQGNQVEFGKNRVQYHDDFKEWLQYESPNFITYWYGKSRNVGQAVVQLAELDHDAIQNILEHRMNRKIELVVYTDLTDMKQSNIGSEETFINTAGQTKIVGNKIFVYFNGDHQHLRYQIREGIASIYLNAMLFGSNLQEIVQNAVMLNLPPWFERGLVAFVGQDWNTTLDNRLKDAVLSEDYRGFEQLAETHPRLAGHSLWYFIGQNYGKSTVSNLLYLTRINRSIESGFLYVLGSNYNRIIDSWENFYQKRYADDRIGRDSTFQNPFPIKNRFDLPLSQVKLSPNGQYLVYVTNDIGKYKVYLHHINTNSRQVIHKGGFRNAFQATDYNYPLISWKPSSYEVSVIYEQRDIIKQMVYDINTEDRITEDIDPQYQRILSADFIDNNRMVLSAIVNGYSDLFIYQTLNRQTQRITSDFWDDLDATIVQLENKKGILFASNRQNKFLKKAKLDTILPIENFDIFYYNLDSKSDTLIRITNTPTANERTPVAIDTTWFAYRSDESGIYNRKVGYLQDVFVYNNKKITLTDQTEIIIHEDSTLTNLDSMLIDTIDILPVFEKQAFVHSNSNFGRNILEFHTATKAKKQVEVFIHNNEHRLYLHPINVQQEFSPPLTKYKTQEQIIQESTSDWNTLPSNNENPVLNKTTTIVIPSTPITTDTIPTSTLEEKEEVQEETGYLFQSEFDEPSDAPIAPPKEKTETTDIILEQPSLIDVSTIQPTEKKIEVHEFKSARIIPSRLKFRTDFITTNFDNSLLFGGLDTYAGDKQEFTTPPIGILLKANFKDLFEDYEIEGGVRVPTTFDGAEYFLTFGDKKKRWDKEYAVYRKSTRNRVEDDNPQSNDERLEEVVTLLGNVQFKYPLDIFRSVRLSSTLRNDRTTTLAEDVATLTRPTINEQRIGAKVEYVYDNTLNVSPNIINGTKYKLFAEVVKRFRVDFDDNIDFEFDSGVMTVLGLDARHYQRIDKRSIFAARLSAATSFGSEKILYFMGGTNGWLFPSFNNDIPLPLNDEFAYQTLAADLRGFRQNIRNGNSFALLNTELRIPIIQYFSRKPIRSAFLRNFQLIGFFDAGTAWQGNTPFSEDNPLNTVAVLDEPNNPVTVRVNYFRDPIVYGYGGGIRSVLFGYFVRVDYAWGVETGVQQDGRFFLSIGTDF